MGDTNTFIPEGIYALANPSSGITALNMNCECNLFGIKTQDKRMNEQVVNRFYFYANYS